MSATTNHFTFVDGLRGVASSAVVLYHVGFGGQRAQLLGNHLPGPLRNAIVVRGGLGVAVFFVLSGFVMAHALRRAHVTPTYTGRFAVRRLARLTPPYYAAIAVAIAVAGIATLVKDQAFVLEDTPLTVARFLTHLPYLQESFSEHEIVSVFWTLCYEVAFYLVFCVLMGIAGALDRVLGGLRGRAVTFGIVAIAALVLSLGHIQGEMRPFPWVRAFFAFLLGVFCYWTVQRVMPLWALGVFGVAVLCTALRAEPDYRYVALATAAVLLFAGRRALMGRWLAGPTMQFLGRTSYSMYLFHSAALTVVYYATSETIGEGVAGQVLYVVVGLLACVVTAAVMWHLVERPSIALSRRVRMDDA
jgi:peptidoglycan/LPS O-acetylase OafA/YrhL